MNYRKVYFYFAAAVGFMTAVYGMAMFLPAFFSPFLYMADGYFEGKALLGPILTYLPIVGVGILVWELHLRKAEAMEAPATTGKAFYCYFISAMCLIAAMWMLVLYTGLFLVSGLYSDGFGGYNLVGFSTFLIPFLILLGVWYFYLRMGNRLS